MKRNKQKLTPELLANVRVGTQNLMKEFLKKNPPETESGLAIKIGIHPAQMLLFMRNERGLTDKSLSRIGKYLSDGEQFK